VKKIITFQDFQNAVKKNELINFLEESSNYFFSSAKYKEAVEAEEYFRGQNRAILNLQSKILVEYGKDLTTTIDINKYKIPTNFLKRLIIQQSGTLLNWGLQLSNENEKKKLGFDYDTVFANGAEKALIHGKSFYYVDSFNNRIINFPMIQGLGGTYLFLDEKNSVARAGIRILQIDTDKPKFIELYEEDGISIYKNNGNGFEEYSKKTFYKQRKRVISGANENLAQLKLPIITIKANEYEDSEFLYIKHKIDAYDKINSGLIETADKVKNVYWILEEFQGTLNSAVKIIEQLQKLGIASGNGGDFKTVKPEVLNIPYQVQEFALNILEKQIYKDYMGYNTDEITGGSLTNVAIKTAIENHMRKVGRWERQQVIESTRQILLFFGIDTNNIKFRYDINFNESEIAQILTSTRDDLDLETALSKNPIIDPDELEMVLKRKAIEEQNQAELTFPFDQTQQSQQPQEPSATAINTEQKQLQGA